MKSNYSNLDMLRALAVLSVVASHLCQQLGLFHYMVYNADLDQFLHNLSITGVMFFFLHTCLVLMLSMQRAPDEHRTRNFWIRRVFRIYPLCWATILLVLATGLTDKTAAEMQGPGWRGITANLFLVHDFFPKYHSVIGPLWSLPLEVQMYLLLPFFFVLMRRFDSLHFVMAMWLGATLLGTVSAQAAVPRVFHAAIFPPMFIAGMVAFHLLKEHRRAVFPSWGWLPVVMGLFLAADRLAGSQSYDSPRGACVYACTCLAAALALPAFGDLRAAWIVRPARQIAKYSYGIYLPHIPALIFVMRDLPGLALPLKLAVFLVLTALLAFIAFHAIEDPLIVAGKRLTRPARARSLSKATSSSLADPATSIASFPAGQTPDRNRTAETAGWC